MTNQFRFGVYINDSIIVNNHFLTFFNFYLNNKTLIVNKTTI